MDDAPLGILVPYAGSSALLRETVASVLSQDDDHWTLLVVEDGPQDPTVGPWLRNLNDPRVRHLVNRSNLGVAGNFQRCLDLADEDYVAFIGCDDRLLPGFVSSARRGLASFPDVDLVQPGVRVIDADGSPAMPLGDRVKSLLARVSSDEVRSGEDLLTTLMLGNWTYFPAMCWRRELVASHGFRQDLDTTLDLALMASLILSDARMLVLADEFFEYRRHAGSFSSRTAQNTERFIEEARLTHEIALAAEARGWTRASRAARWRLTSRLHAGALLPSALMRGDRQACRAIAKHAFRR